jgi:hypothetical protein
MCICICMDTVLGSAHMNIRRWQAIGKDAVVQNMLKCKAFVRDLCEGTKTSVTTCLGPYPVFCFFEIHWRNLFHCHY